MKRLPSLVATLALLLLFGAVSRPAEAQTCTAGALTSIQTSWNIVAPTTTANNLPLTQSVTIDLYTAVVTTGSAPPSASAYAKTMTGIGPLVAGASTTVTQSTGVGADQTIYGYVIANDANGGSAPSSVACKSFPQDTSPPGKPGLSAS